MMNDARPYMIDVDQEILRDLRERLGRSGWPDEVPDAGWDYGVSLAYLTDLVEYWRTDFDWRRQEARLNRLADFTIAGDGPRGPGVPGPGRGLAPCPRSSPPAGQRGAIARTTRLPG